MQLHEKRSASGPLFNHTCALLVQLFGLYQHRRASLMGVREQLVGRRYNSGAAGFQLVAPVFLPMMLQGKLPALI
jgi:hypothetical protein